MSFTSTPFIFALLPLSIIIYYLSIPLKKISLQNSILILVSLAFYSFGGLRPLVLVLGLTATIHLFAKLLEFKKTKGLLALEITSLVLLLSYFKYTGFFSHVFNNHFLDSVAMPLGLSFITFEAISYLVDVYTNQEKPKSLLEIFLFIFFFPKVLSGPIVLWRDFAPQLEKRLHSSELFFKGINRIMVGFAKKAIIADTLGATVLKITYNLNFGIDSPTALFGALCYFFQIYYDFSGYSDIAIGISNIFGFNLFENFNHPYISTSIGEFWRRWHASLGAWFKNYIYIPLGGNKKNVYLNLFIVFVITGIWHGSTWNFVIWGLLHGILSMIERYIRNKKWYIHTPKLIKWIFTMLFVYFSWIIFMLPSSKELLIYIQSIFGYPVGDIFFNFEYFFSFKLIVILIVAMIGSVIPETTFFKDLKEWTEKNKLGLIIKEIVLLTIFVLAILFMVNSSYTPFLYFQF